MHFATYIPLVMASAAAAQSMTLAQVLSAQNSTLSMLNCLNTALLGSQPALLNTLSSANRITLLAPSNDAFSKFLLNSGNKAAAGDPATLLGLLQYHVMTMTVPASSFTTTQQFIPTMLMPASSNSTGATNASSTLTAVTGGQVVGGMKKGNDVVIMSGLKDISTVKTADIMFSGGVMHIIDTVLTLPLAPSNSAIDSALTALAGGLKQTNLLNAVDNLSDVTIFAPSNVAFEKIGSAATTLTTEQLSSILEYHVINGTVGYSSLLTTGLANESFPTLAGSTLMITAEDGKVFVNSAQVIVTDIIVSNGVMHIIDNVLNPANSTALPNPTATTQGVAFAGVSSATNVPFTSGIVATTTASFVSAKSGAANMGIENASVGMIGVAALFGIVAGVGL